MAILSNTSPLYGATGVVGGLLLRSINGKTVVSVYVPPKKRRKTSALQQLTRSRFAEASQKVKALLRDIETYEYYKRKAKKLGGGNAYTAALTDLMRRSEPAAADAISPAPELLRAKRGQKSGIRKAGRVSKPVALTRCGMVESLSVKRDSVVRFRGAPGIGP